MVGIRFCRCGCEWAPVRGFIRLLWSAAHTKGLRVRFPTRPEENEDWQSPGAVRKRKKLATVKERLQSEGGGCWRRTCDLWIQRLGRRVREDKSAFLVAVGKFRSDIRWRESQMQRGWQKSAKNPFLRLGLTQVRSCWFFFLPLSVIYVISVVYL